MHNQSEHHGVQQLAYITKGEKVARQSEFDQRHSGRQIKMVGQYTLMRIIYNERQPQTIEIGVNKQLMV